MMVQYHLWMFDASMWYMFPRPYEAWNLVMYHMVAAKSKTKVTPEQIRYFDYTFACMMQKETGWH